MSDKTRIKQITNIIFAVLAGIFLSDYFQFEFRYVAFAILFIVLYYAVGEVEKQRFKKSENVIIAVFSFLFTLAIILGYHIHVESGYSGTIANNYILEYTVKDFFAFFFIFVGLMVLVGCLYAVVSNNKKAMVEIGGSSDGISFKYIGLIMACFFLAWLPYLLIYYPGFIFGDSIASIRQALGLEAWNNHHPIFYSYFIKICLFFGRQIVDNTLGCAIYSVIQMLYLAFCFAYQICWIKARTRVSRKWIAFLTVIFGITPYVAQMSVAMWKDPVFSATLVVFSLKLMDMILSRGKVFGQDKFFILKYVLLSAIIIFSRNNGIYIIVFTTFIMIICWLDNKRSKLGGMLKVMLAISVLIVITAKVITGPIYDRLNIQKEPVEAYGVFLNQMARVVACGGDLSETDKEYMDSLLPLEQYAEKYRPCCTDLLKWDAEFNAGPLEDNFFQTYLSILVKNPKLCIESWELQTFGFWTVNQKGVNTATNNITGGAPWNFSESGQASLENYGIVSKNLLGSERWKEIFPMEDHAIPLGMINWLLLLLICFLIMRKKRNYLLALAPTFGLFLTLAIASPIFYWQRYEAAVQFLLPFYILVFLNLGKDDFMINKDGDVDK